MKEHKLTYNSARYRKKFEEVRAHLLSLDHEDLEAPVRFAVWLDDWLTKGGNLQAAADAGRSLVDHPGVRSILERCKEATD